MQNIDAEQVFKQIKKYHGEQFAQIIRGDRDHGENLCFVPNIVHILKFAGNNPEDAKKLRLNILEIYRGHDKSEYYTDKTPLELLSEAGYDAFVVKTEQQKNSIKKYFRAREELCTFGDSERHEKYYMIHAVKRGAEKIKPSDTPDREDEYGTSVISIQIIKTGGFISIKNRYNHTVNNPDATFNNNPDNIIHGLSNSLKKYFHVDFYVSKSEIPANFRIVNNQFVYFNYEIDNTYFGPDYYFSGSTITKLNKNYEIMLDNFILNTGNGELTDVLGKNNSTYKILKELFNGKIISERTNPNNKREHMIYANGTHVLSVENGTITEMHLQDIKYIEDGFLQYNKNLRKFSAPKLEYVGNEFLSSNKNLTELNLPSLKKVGHSFLSHNQQISKFNAPHLEKAKSCFLMENTGLTELNLPSMIEIEDHSLDSNTNLSKFSAPKLEKIGPLFLMDNLSLKELELPRVKEIGGGFLRDNKILESFYAPELEKIGDHVMSGNLALTELNLPSLKEVGQNFLFDNKKLKIFYAPKLQNAHYGFLAKNTELTNIYIANNDIIHRNKRLVMIINKNKIKRKIKNSVNGIINTVKRIPADKTTEF